jgi:hypothetical protein
MIPASNEMKLFFQCLNTFSDNEPLETLFFIAFDCLFNYEITNISHNLLTVCQIYFLTGN